MSDAAAAPHGTYRSDLVKSHPVGLYLLFTTEMWERLSYYGMRALLVLYMTAETTKGGLGWTKVDALALYGWYTMFVYVTPIFGGLLADRVLGQRRAVTIGGVLMMIGHFLMAVPGLAAFYGALLFLIVGNGFFKPNISTMVGGFYRPGDARRDGAFTIFYMGINLGAFLAPLVCGTLGQKVGWHWGFGAAGVGMLLGLMSFLLFGQRLLGDIGKKVSPAAGQVKAELPPLTSDEWDRLKVVFALCMFNIFFWAAFEQAGGFMNLYADEKTDLSLDHGMVVTLGYVLVAGLAAVTAWAIRGCVRAWADRASFEGVERFVVWVVGTSVVAALTVGTGMYIGDIESPMPSSWFQSLNPLFIVGLGPVFAWMWLALARADREPSIPGKFASALIVQAIAFFLMLGAAAVFVPGEKVSKGWLTGFYLFSTLAELCLSPVGLSAMTKLAPPRMASMIMGLFFLSISVGNKLAGVLGEYSEKLGEFGLFTTIGCILVAAGIALFVLAPMLKKMMHGADTVSAPAH